MNNAVVLGHEPVPRPFAGVGGVLEWGDGGIIKVHTLDIVIEHEEL